MDIKIQARQEKARATKDANEITFKEFDIEVGETRKKVVLRKDAYNWIITINNENQYYSNFSSFITGVVKTVHKRYIKDLSLDATKVAYDKGMDSVADSGEWADVIIRTKDEEIYQLKLKLNKKV